MISHLNQEIGLPSLERDSSNPLKNIEIHRLKQALLDGEFELWFQPIIDSVTAKVTGFESLIRWKDPDTGEIVFPDRFMPAIEEDEFIIDFGFWIINEACARLRTWIDRFGADRNLYVSVNLSARQFRCAELVDRIIEIIDRHSIDPSSFVLEITESAFMEDIEFTKSMLDELKAGQLQLA